MDQSIFERGFSLVEQLTAVSVTAAALALVVPAYGNLVRSHRLATQANLLLTSLHLARSEAIKRNARVVVCKSASGSRCSESGGWHQGWIVFEDANNNARLEEGETLLRRIPASPDGYALTGNAPVARYVSYTPLGQAKLISGAFQAGALTLCHPDARNGEGRRIVINIGGRPRVSRAAVSSCG